jgi:hypothetical protein
MSLKKVSKESNRPRKHKSSLKNKKYPTKKIRNKKLSGISQSTTNKHRSRINTKLTKLKCLSAKNVIT